MKKLLISLLTLLLVAGCASQKEEIKEDDHLTTIVCPSGAPSLALLPLLNNDKYQLDIVDGSEVLQAEFVKGESDIVIAPINLGVKLSEKTGNYYLYSIVTTSNLYLVTDKDEINTIAAFGEQAVPGKILGYLSDRLNVKEIDYFESVNEAVAAYSNNQYDAVVAAYPVIKKLLKNEDVKITNLLDLYNEKSGYENYPQAALFVSKNYLENHHELLINTYNSICESFIKFKNSNDEFNNYLDSVDIKTLGFADVNLIKNSYNELGLNVIPINDYLNESKQFLNLFNIEFQDSIIVTN